MRARWASVSTFWISVGRPRTPRSNSRGGVNVGWPAPPFSQLHERALLAGHEAVGHGHELDLLALCRLGALVDGLDGRMCRRCVAADRDDDSPRARDRGRDHRAVQHEVRIDAHQQRVLLARGLALDAVRDHDRARARRRPHAA